MNTEHRGTLARMVVFAVSGGFSIIQAAVVVRHLGVDGTAHYLLGTAVAVLCAGILEGGLTTLAVREMATRSAAERPGWFGEAIFVRFILVIAAMPVGIAAAAALGQSGDLALAVGGSAAGWMVLHLQVTLLAPVWADGRLLTIAAFDLLRAALQLAALVGGALVGLGPAALLLTVIPVHAAGGAAALLVVRRSIAVTPRRPRSVRPFVSLTWPNTSQIVYLRVPVVWVSLAVGSAQTAFYGVAARVVELGGALPILLAGSALPRLARGDATDAGAVLRLAVLAAVFGAGVGLALVALAGPVIDLVAGPDFAEAKPVMRILAVSVALAFPQAALVYSAYGGRREGVVGRLYVVALLAQLVAVVAGAQLNGARGAALGAVCADVLLLALTAVVLRQPLSRRRSDAAHAPGRRRRRAAIRRPRA